MIAHVAKVAILVANTFPQTCRNALAENGRDCEFFTIMRHPIDRVVSAFFYCPKDHDQQTNRPSKVSTCLAETMWNTAQHVLTFPRVNKLRLGTGWHRYNTSPFVIDLHLSLNFSFRSVVTRQDNAQNTTAYA